MPVLAVLVCMCVYTRCMSVTGATHMDVPQTGNGHDTLILSLIVRIDQLEEVVKSRDAKHEAEITALRNAYMKDISALRDTVDRQASQIEELESRLHKHDNTIQRLLQSEQTVVSREDVSARIINDKDKTRGNASGTGNMLQNRIRRQTNDAVAFFATLVNPATNLGANQNIAFEHVITNVGKAYIPHVGAFIAQIPGTYVFSVTVAAADSLSCLYGVFKNTERVATLFVNATVHDLDFDSSSQTAILTLRQGDDVTVKNLESNHNLRGQGYSSFSGFLLVPDFSGSLVGK